MAEYDKGRYYWIKLTDRFMTSDTVDFLMAQKDGANYVVLYQMLCLKTVNNDGVLARKLGEIIIPFDEEKIVRDCKWFSIDTVRIALGLYKRLGLIYENQDGVLAISNFKRLIGSQTYGAERRQLQRQGDNCHSICHPEIEIRDEDTRDKDIDIEINNKTTTTNNNDLFLHRGAEEYANQGEIDTSAGYLDSDGFKFYNLIACLFGELKYRGCVDDFIVYNSVRNWRGIGGEDILKDEATLARYIDRWARGENN